MRFSANALLFDSDETLVSSLRSVRRVWSQWTESYGMTLEEAMARVQVHGRPAAEIAAALLPADQVAEGVRRLVDAEVADAVAGNVKPVPGAIELLASLPQDRWAVVTSGSRRIAEARLHQVGIHPKFLVTSDDDLTHYKPHPEPFLLAAERLGVEPSRCVVFEDAPAGLTAGRAAGMATIALTTTHRADELAADATVADLTAVSARVMESGDLEITVN
ncbi:HAD-IA family hydrolase [Streptomyces albireticuli]|uniref:Phosphatase n=1 Tax=Streptomyces albireticuli TaxID=1940 RepID=A0A2A2D1V5_9ACTN|nr:HAD-IA family hydrolase [Streptomyces albireticuli]MCD9146019.1 HAD-IA family hydrolase [Streptomyces albireticuli]MCD9165739.1 HAD-IA family hydrolase [Streptomyces albireticuli]MCD9195957.1 HAD-IA family hydrolase [Streptomyces albireticuli]PAU46403.1 phosphatase [Streptomyces albireticuli]